IIIDNIIGDQQNLKQNIIALGADTAGFFIPLATGLGTATKAGSKIDNVIDSTAKADKVGVVKYGDEISSVTSKSGTQLLPEAKWGVNHYRHGGQMSAIEHINYRHSFNSEFQNVSKFSKGTSVKYIKSYVDEALSKGAVTSSGNNGFKIEYDFGRNIGTTQSGNPATAIRIFVRDGNIQTAFPVSP
ncbi:MAG: hypothetical protein JRJ44_09465, partial [Deltaproteobacteria bacterium]|nr:hypothetical protein [Deltaproteobacteria bacterium]